MAIKKWFVSCVALSGTLANAQSAVPEISGLVTEYQCSKFDTSSGIPQLGWYRLIFIGSKGTLYTEITDIHPEEFSWQRRPGTLTVQADLPTEISYVDFAPKQNKVDWSTVEGCYVFQEPGFSFGLNLKDLNQSTIQVVPNILINPATICRIPSIVQPPIQPLSCQQVR